MLMGGPDAANVVALAQIDGVSGLRRALQSASWALFATALMRKSAKPANAAVTNRFMMLPSDGVRDTAAARTLSV
jgi:hypothetical protein